MSPKYRILRNFIQMKLKFLRVNLQTMNNEGYRFTSRHSWLIFWILASFPYNCPLFTPTLPPRNAHGRMICFMLIYKLTKTSWLSYNNQEFWKKFVRYQLYRTAFIVPPIPAVLYCILPVPYRLYHTVPAVVYRLYRTARKGCTVLPVHNVPPKEANHEKLEKPQKDVILPKLCLTHWNR